VKSTSSVSSSARTAFCARATELPSASAANAPAREPSSRRPQASTRAHVANAARADTIRPVARCTLPSGHETSASVQGWSGGFAR
jgi:hypothetical protein